MVSYSTLSRLAKAEEKALAVGFEGTAERLAILRRQLEGFKSLSGPERDSRAYWALSKVDDTSTCLARESLARKEERDELERSTKAVANVTRGALCGFALALAVRISDILGSSEPGAVLPALAMLSVGTFAASRMIGAVIGANRFDDTVRYVERLMEECRAGLPAKEEQTGDAGPRAG